jgi:predicted nucleic acid-binding protein
VGRAVIALDTSAIFALLNRADPDHLHVREAIEGDRGPYLVPAGILAEVAYLVERRLGVKVLDSFIGDLQAGGFTLDCGEHSLPRVRELLIRYADLRLGFADATVIACAERNGRRVLTLDRRDFDVVAGEGTIEVLPA